VFPPSPTDQPLQFLGCELRDVPGGKLATSGHHLLGGKPDAQIPELDETRAVCPPEKTELDNREETEPSMWLFCLHSRIVISSHVASLV